LNENQNTNPTLLALATVTRQVAQELIDKNLIVQLCATILSCFAFFNNEQIAWVLVSLGFICKIASFIINIRGQHYHNISREAQRLALLEDAYGKILDNFQVVELRRKISSKIDDKAKLIPYAQPYYSSGAKTGNGRLKENIQQSTFWSKNLLEIYAKRILATFIISLSILGVLTYVLLVTRPEENLKILNPYLLTLGALTFILGLVDYFNIWLSCKSAVNLLTEVDQRLEKIDIDNFEILLANFADYGIASVTAPPIPFKSYKQNQKRLKELWDQRIGKIEEKRSEALLSVPSSARPIIELADSIIPSWITKENFSTLLFSVSGELSNRATGNYSINKITVVKIESLSGVPVFDIQLFCDDVLFRHLILRLHKDPDKARKELGIIKKISDEGVDLVSYTPLEEPFISQGALFYYHVDIQTHDQLFHINDFVISFLENSSPDFESYFNKMLLGFKTIANVYEKISGNYSPKSLSDCLTNMKQSLPPTYILDLRQMQLEVKDNFLTVSKNGKYPKENDTIISSPFNPLSEDWFKSDFQIFALVNFNNDVIEISIKLNNENCKVLLSSKKYSELLPKINGKISLLFSPKESLQPVNKFFETECNLFLDGFNPTELISNLHSLHPRQGLYFAFRHRDLHCKNCLTSRSNFKVIDVADSNEAMICSDIARLEISLLSYLINKFQLDHSAIEKIMTQIETGKNIDGISEISLQIAKLIKSVRDCFYTQFKVSPSDIDIALCYYLELCQQLTYSISSPMKLSKGIEPVIHYWNQKINKHTIKPNNE